MATTTTNHDTASTIRRAFRANAVFSTVTGAIGLVAGSWVVAQLGLDDGWHVLVRIIGAGLLGFAGILLWESRQSVDRIVPTALQISIADFGWVLGSVALIIAGAFSTRGAVIVAVIAVAVDGLASAQLWGRRKALRSSTAMA